jgi:folate-binding protein YgfZ
MLLRQQYRSILEGAGLLERADRGRLRLTGADRRGYLQGLLTNDIAALLPGDGCYAALLTAQGRMIADMRVWELGDAVLMDLHTDLTTSIRERFDQFIFSEDVQVHDATGSLAQFGLYGPAASRALSMALQSHTVPDAPAPGPDELDSLRASGNRSFPFDGATVIVGRSDEIGVSGFDLLLDRSHAGALASALEQAGAEPVSMAAIEVLRIEAGRPAFLVDMDEHTIPLEAGIEDRAISLTKGCYVGQEIIVRVLHRGHGRVARRLVGLKLETGAQIPSSGDRLRADDRDIGTVTSAALSPALERPIALGYVHRDFVEPGTVVTVLHGDQADRAVVARLPFVDHGSSA